MTQQLYRLDGVLWTGGITPRPFCPRHKLEMDAYTYDEGDPEEYKYDHLRCEECEEDYVIPRDITAEKQYIGRKLRSLELKDIKVLNLDDEAVPIAEDKIISEDKKFFVKAILTKSKVGQRLIIYAGERGKKEKTQIFVEPKIKRLAFDQKDLHPKDVFLKVEAIFDDGSSSAIKSK